MKERKKFYVKKINQNVLNYPRKLLSNYVTEMFNSIKIKCLIKHFGYIITYT